MALPNQYMDANGNRKPDAPEGQNHFTTGKRTKQDEQTKAKIRAAFAASKLEDFLKGEVTLDSAQVSAAKALMDKGMPSLQAVESKTVNEFEDMDENQLNEYVRALILSRPELLRQFAPGIRDASQQTEPNAVQHSQPEGDKAA